MCQPKDLSEFRNEIDMRVGAALAKREVERYQYQRGFYDCLYLLMLAVGVAIIFWPEIKQATGRK